MWHASAVTLPLLGDSVAPLHLPTDAVAVSPQWFGEMPLPLPSTSMPLATTREQLQAAQLHATSGAASTLANGEGLAQKVRDEARYAMATSQGVCAFFDDALAKMRAQAEARAIREAAEAAAQSKAEAEAREKERAEAEAKAKAAAQEQARRAAAAEAARLDKERADAAVAAAAAATAEAAARAAQEKKLQEMAAAAPISAAVELTPALARPSVPATATAANAALQQQWQQASTSCMYTCMHGMRVPACMHAYTYARTGDSCRGGVHT